jgi:hypothetical protein
LPAPRVQRYTAFVIINPVLTIVRAVQPEDKAMHLMFRCLMGAACVVMPPDCAQAQARPAKSIQLSDHESTEVFFKVAQ